MARVPQSARISNNKSLSNCETRCFKPNTKFEQRFLTQGAASLYDTLMCCWRTQVTSNKHRHNTLQYALLQHSAAHQSSMQHTAICVAATQ